MTIPSRLRRFHIVGCSPEGLRLIDGSDELRRALEMYTAALKPEMVVPTGVRLLSVGKFGFAFRMGDLILKVTSPTSSIRPENRTPRPPEDLTKQFRVMGALAEHLGEGREGVVAPAQFFVAHTPHNTYVLGQEFMAGWRTLEDATVETFPDANAPGLKQTAREIVTKIRSRVEGALQGFAFRDQIDDLGRDPSGPLHGTNILLPVGVSLSPDAPLCIIDQPGHPDRENVKRRTST
jgi:hypothetical protein